MNFHRLTAIVPAIFLALGISAATAQSNTAQDLIDGIVNDVVNRTIHTAQEEVRRNTGIDLRQRGYDPNRQYQPLREDASDETRRELQQLNEEHDRKIAKLQDELERDLRKAEAEFEREARRESKPEKIRKKREKLEKKVDKAYGKFEDKIARENERFDEKRDRIISRSRG